MTYTYRATSYQAVVNGVTGRMGGTYPVSWIKVALIVIALLIVIAVLAATQ